jgi:hypothetical protein
MQKAEHGGWEVTLQLRPGTYRHRFYVEDGGVVVLVPGWEAAPVARPHGLDGVITVFDKQSKRRCFSQARR